MRQVYLTSGSTSKFYVAKNEVVVKKAPAWMLKFSGTEEGNAIRAMAWMGEKSAAETVSTIHKKVAPQNWETIVKASCFLPSWMAKAIGQEMAHP